MTNKPMLSVELRALLERLLSHDFAEECQECGIGYSDAWGELRALLDKPEQPPVADLLLASAHSYVKVAGETQNLARHLQSKIEVYFDGEPAAQLHGDPVGEVVHVSEDQIRIGLYDEYSLKVGDLVYAEPPASAAVVMPERKTEFATEVQGAYLRGWNACRDETARLNGVKP